MRRLLSCFLLLIIAIPMAVAAQPVPEPSPCAVPAIRTDVRPDPKGPPTDVTIGMRLADLLEINDVNQTITVDVMIRMQWTDPRLAELGGCKVSISDIWFPLLIMKNSGRIFERWPATASIEDGGQVTYQQRASGTFSSYHQLANYPFDTQDIALRFYPLDWSLSKLAFTNDASFTGMTPLLNISDWRVNGVSAEVVEVDFPILNQTRAGYELTISTQRYIGYYIWKILFPIAMIVVMSWTVFWIDPAEFGTQMGLSATSVLTMVAFIFATTNMLPKLGHFTMLDRYIAWATLFVFVALLQSLATGYLVANGRKAIAGRLDLISRFVFPAAFSAICLNFYLKTL